jgi:hypothetical protein
MLPRGTMGQSNLQTVDPVPRVSAGRPGRGGSFVPFTVVPVSRRPFIWLSVLCLDAPLVAIGWQWLFARAFTVQVLQSHRAALFLTAWFIYMFDRFTDAISLRPHFPKSVRQQTCLDHVKSWVILIVLVGAVDAGIIFTRLEHTTTMRGLFLGAVAVCYLALNWAANKVWERVPLKEFIIGLLFAAGTVVVSVPSSLIEGSTIGLTAAIALFIGLCWLNCISIAVWERELDRSQSKHSIATRWLGIAHFARVSLILLVTISLLLAHFNVINQTLAPCLGTSAILLLALHFIPLWRDERTALADLVLLTPFAFWFFAS